MMIRAIKENPCIDVITHLDAAPFEVDFEPVAREAMAAGMAVEINNSKSRPRVAVPEATRELIATCKRLECPVVVCSDAHALNEVGCDDLVRPLLEEAGFPEELIRNGDAESAFRFVEECRRKRQS
jgi:histidinol phosphatase-like PHP family hydrolase